MHELTRSLKSSSSLLFAFLYEAAATRTLAPSTLARSASVLALGLSMTHCVPAKSYDEARTAARVASTVRSPGGGTARSGRRASSVASAVSSCARSQSTSGVCIEHPR